MSRAKATILCIDDHWSGLIGRKIFLEQSGYEVLEQGVQGPRRNLYVSSGKADVVFSTHLDCVPPFFPSRLDGDSLFGRGSCDAKGIIATMVTAAILAPKISGFGTSMIG